MSRGLLNQGNVRPAEGDPQGRTPNFQDGNLERDLELLDALEKIPDQRGVSTAQLAIAWVAAGRGRHPADRNQTADPARGGRRRSGPEADPGTGCDIGAAVPHAQVAGTRYDAAQMGALNHSRPGPRAP